MDMISIALIHNSQQTKATLVEWITNTPKSNSGEMDRKHSTTTEYM